METILALLIGISLAAASGFRVFLPLLAMSIASHFGIIPLSDSWEWVGGYTAIITLGAASLVEIVAYYIPWLDNLLDSIAIPLAGVAGSLLVAASIGDMSPIITWSLAIIAGGGTAAAIKTGGATTRLASTATTAGIGNPIVSSVETGTSIVLSLFSIFAPILAFIFVLIIFYIFYRIYRKFKRKKEISEAEE